MICCNDYPYESVTLSTAAGTPFFPLIAAKHRNCVTSATALNTCQASTALSSYCSHDDPIVPFGLNQPKQPIHVGACRKSSGAVSRAFPYLWGHLQPQSIAYGAQLCRECTRRQCSTQLATSPSPELFASTSMIAALAAWSVVIAFAPSHPCAFSLALRIRLSLAGMPAAAISSRWQEGDSKYSRKGTSTLVGTMEQGKCSMDTTPTRPTIVSSIVRHLWAYFVD
ncbi:hypothetical protein NEOLEDRAFT_295560 [Neolentinus lepideus HHB14362 ss-1]|uniref:Uncharacterized protein n=1 Tax=Neolentinus lepideus HHB14362 ss-1 TaxID=1314782 RepID=A0A165T1B9_9AGAM|nr:hypothetical protein NEOLEDRAFT_295560 [Neolentinus lepideus HHB14362 ss-1]